MDTLQKNLRKNKPDKLSDANAYRRTRAQASFEYLAIFAIAFAILIPMVYMFQEYSLKSAENLQYSQIRTIGEDLANTAETVYYMGYPARLTIQESFPSGIIDLEIASNWTAGSNIISFYTATGEELPIFCKVNLNATINESSYTPGLKNIRFDTRNSTQGNYVQITIE
jgi:hypothetical protein